MTRSLTGLAFAALSALLWAPAQLAAQAPAVSLQAQTGIVVGSTAFSALGVTLGVEVAVHQNTRLYASWSDREAIVPGCTVADAPSTCNGDADSWELGVRQGFRDGRRLMPFLGVGVGVWSGRDLDGGASHDGGAPAPDTDRGVSVFFGAGVELPVASAFAFRASVEHQEVLDSALEDRFGERVRYTGFLVGGSVAVR